MEFFVVKTKMPNLSIKDHNLFKFYVSKTLKSSSMQERGRRECALCKKMKKKVCTL